MIESFKKHNPHYNLKYFNQTAVDAWFENSIYNDAYKKLTERGEITDFFRYCYLYENGGVYSDCDIFFNQPIDDWLIDQDLVVGLEALVDKDNNLGFDNIGVRVGDKYASVANWFFAIKPKHPILSNIINDIINNPDPRGVLQNTGPGRFSKHFIPYFGLDSDFTKDIRKGRDELLSINRFGSNQSHSNAKKYNDIFKVDDEDIYVTHLFDGKWRQPVNKDKINIYNTEHCSHNLSLIKTVEGYKGIARLDEDTSRTRFMEQLGDCRTLYEFLFSADLALQVAESRVINYPKLAKFEDARSFSYKNKVYHSMSYIDENWNTKIALLDNEYNYIKDIKVKKPNRMRFGVGEEVEWEKNYLFWVHNDTLQFIYNTSPNFIVYKDKGNFEFEEIINVENHVNHKFPKDELYFSENCKVGGSTSPIWIDRDECYVYMVHTKIYNERSYNHWLVKLDKDLNIIDVSYKPLFNKNMIHKLFFVSTWILQDDFVICSGGIEDNKNWTWKLPISRIKNCFK